MPHSVIQLSGRERDIFSPTMRDILTRMRGGSRLYFGRRGDIAWIVDATTGKSEAVRPGTVRRMKAMKLIEPFRRYSNSVQQLDLRQKLTKRGRCVDVPSADSVSSF